MKKILVVVFILLFSSTVQAESPIYDGKVVLFGNPTQVTNKGKPR